MFQFTLFKLLYICDNVSFSFEEASYAEAKYQLSYNQYLIQIIVVISYALYCGVPVFKPNGSSFSSDYGDPKDQWESRL